MPHSLSKYGQYKEDIFIKLAYNFEAGKKMLDVGCGDGSDAKILAKEFKLDVYGIDVYEHPNIAGVKNLKFKKVSEGIYDIPFKDGMFDYVFLHDVLHHVDEKRQSPKKHKAALQEVKRVCKKEDGCIVIVEGNRYNPLFYPHMVKMRKHEHFSQSYFKKLVESVFPNAKFKYFEAHKYPEKLLWFFKLYEMLMEKFVLKSFLSYNVAIIDSHPDEQTEVIMPSSKLGNIIEKVKLYGIKTSIGYIANEIRYRLFYNLLFKSYSQEREDIFIDKFFEGKSKGFYVDVGAHDPVRFSNTKRFYDKGWSGINIEPDAELYERFVKDRTRDTNLNLGIGSKKGKFTFFKMFPSTLSTFSEDEAKDYERQGYKILEKVQVPMMRLDSILEKYSKGRRIDFFSIDTEGYDLEVLQSNDWDSFSPKLICIESVAHTKNFEGASKEGIYSFLVKKGYKKVFDNQMNSIFVLPGT
ncbi:FkbM family methyltransferase [Patescibacteria group bacterium]